MVKTVAPQAKVLVQTSSTVLSHMFVLSPFASVQTCRALGVRVSFGYTCSTPIGLKPGVWD